MRNYTADRDIWVTANFERTVSADDRQRAFLLVRKGGIVPAYVAAKYGLLQEEPGVEEGSGSGEYESEGAGAPSSRQPEAQQKQEYVNDKRRGRKKWR